MGVRVRVRLGVGVRVRVRVRMRVRVRVRVRQSRGWRGRREGEEWSGVEWRCPRKTRTPH